MESWVLQMNIPVHLGATARPWYCLTVSRRMGTKELPTSQAVSLHFPLICCWSICNNILIFWGIINCSLESSHWPSILGWWQGVSQYLLLQSFTKCHASGKWDKMTDNPCNPSSWQTLQVSAKFNTTHNFRSISLSTWVVVFLLWLLQNKALSQ